MIKHFLTIAALLLTSSLFAQAPALVPQPVDLRMGKGSFIITPATTLIARDAEEARIAAMLNDYLEQYYGTRLAQRKEAKGSSIRFVTRRFIKAPDKDAYSLVVDKNGITIEGDTYPGTFYGLQTLLQLLPLPTAQTSVPKEIKIKQKPGKTKIKTSGTVNDKPQTANHKLAVSYLSISDYPRFSYRGLHLDVSRHYFPVSFIKKYIDLIAAHKLNTFHWHLTDDQGWRIEIRQYPLLTSIGGWRHGTITGRYPGTGNTNTRYGGFYTQEEVREVVRYAAQRYVTVLPEIDVPGHASAAIAAYPWLSCFPEEPSIIPTWPSTGSKAAQAAGKPKQVQETWGVFYDLLCAGNDSTFTFLESVLDEVMELFPGQYVHVGGDEAPKSQWKRCPRCQARMKAEGLKDEHELQSYFIRRLERHVNKAGRNIFGWDEILEGGLAPNAAVMSWQGERGGILAAKEKHQVVMTPQTPLYFDYSQTKTDDSLTRGGFNPLDSIYTYEPLPRGLDSASARYILGAQANVWTEYLTNPAKVEYMVFPRLAALSEALWTPKEKRSWSSFESRLPQLFARYDLWKVAASRAFYYLKPDLQPDTVRGGMILRVSSKLPDPEITFARTSSKATRFTYKDSIRIDGSDTLFVYLGGNRKPYIHYVPFAFQFSKSTAKRVTLKTAPNRSYPGLGAFSLVNATWSAKGLSNPDWLGFLGNDIDATIDFGKTETFTSVRMHTLDQNGSWIYLPQSVEIQVSDDGQNFRTVGQSKEFVKESPTLTQGWIRVTFPPTTARYLRVFAKNYGVIPEGQPGAGTRAWLFADELVVE